MSELVVVPIPARAGYYSVSTGGGTYETSEHSCSCPSYVYRCADAGEPCKHIRALCQHLEEQRACPVCHGGGEIILREQYPTSEQPVCAVCSGTGLRDLEAERREQDARLREMFR